MSQSIKDIFYHALLARASYSEMKSNDLQDWSLLEDEAGQSAMNKVMADFIQSRFDFIASSLDNNGSIELQPSTDASEAMSQTHVTVDGYDGIVFREKATGNYILA